MSNNEPIKKESSKRYMVFRSGVQVSETIHNSMESAEKEKRYWEGILHRYPDGSKMKIEEVNKHQK